MCNSIYAEANARADPESPSDRDQVIRVRGDNPVGDGILTIADLGIGAYSFEAVLSVSLGPNPPVTES